MKSMKLIGIDYGSKRVGVAVSSDDGTMAFPRTVLENSSKLLEMVAAFCVSEGATGIVVGDSKNYAGENNPIMQKILPFAAGLEKLTNLPVRFEPEFLTSAEAERIQGKGKLHDASAAAILLQSYLEKHREEYGLA
jgi:putative Holliday junction resolvase